MAYDFEAYEADRATIGFHSNELVTVKGLTSRRKRLMLEEGADQAKIDAAIARLKAWKESREPEPAPSADAYTEADIQSALGVDVWLAWNEALAAQSARHARRRGRYPAVHPQEGEPEA